MKAKSSSLFPILLLATLAFTSCQLPLDGGPTGRIEVRNPYAEATQRGGGKPLVAYPQNVLASLDHYVLKILTSGGDPIASLPDQTVAPGSPVFSVDRIAPGNYKVVVEAWSAGPVKTAEASQAIAVTAGNLTTVNTLTLVPLASGGVGTFHFSVSVSSGFGTLATSGDLSANLSQLNYSLGDLSGVPTPLAKSLFTFTPSGSNLTFDTTSTLAAGNYLITVERKSVSLDSPASVPLVSILVQVYPGQDSTIGSASLSDGWLDNPASSPQGVRAEMDALGNIYVSWDAPVSHQITDSYQIGYALNEAAADPEATLSMALGSGDNVAGSMLERSGSRLRVKVASGVAPFSLGDTLVALFVRSVAGLSTPSAWTIVTFDPTALVPPRPIPALVFYDLKPGASYVLQKRASDLSVVDAFDLTMGSYSPSVAPAGTTFTFPGLAVAPGESLVLVHHQPDGTAVDTPLAFDAVNVLDASRTYDPSEPYYVYPATRDPAGQNPTETWILLPDLDSAALGAAALDPAPTVSLTTPEGNTVVGWTGTELGGPHLSRTYWTLETDSSAGPEKILLASGDTEYTALGDWAPQAGKVTHYRARAVYGPITFNGVGFEILGPPSGWLGYDRQKPAIFVDSWGTFSSVGALTTVFRYTDDQTENDAPSAMTVSLWAWSGGEVATSTLGDGSFVTINGVTTWTPPVSWTGEGAITIDTLESYQLKIHAVDASGNETSVGIALKGGQ